MADKSLKEFGTDMCHGRFDSSQSSTLYSNHGYKKQPKSKGSPYSGKDKRGHDRQPSHPGKVLQPRNGNRPHPPKQNGRGQVYDHRSSDQRYGQFGQERVKHKSPTTPASDSFAESEGQQGGKKKPTPTSLNHLLNFTIAPAERRSSVGPGTLPPVSSGRRRRPRAHSFNKEQFLQANCQFVVSAAGDYAVHSSDPDRLVDWDQIEQVRLFCHEIPSCPICLYPPKAAKMTRCGHVYCWSCVLHYLSLSDKKWRKCPICYESIYKKDLKSVTALASHQYSVGDTLTLKLMVRRKGTTLALPKKEWSARGDGPLTLQDTTVNQFAKLLLASPAEVLALITGPERGELESLLSSLDTDSQSEQAFVECALAELAAREASLREAGADVQEAATLAIRLEEAAENIADPQSPPSVGETTPTWTSFADNYFKSSFESPFSEGEGPSQHNSSVSSKSSLDESGTDLSVTESPSHSPPIGRGQEVTGIEQEVDHTPNSNPASGPSSSEGLSDSTPPLPHSDPDLVYFYQASDGQHLYLHPINAKCLMKEYGGLEFGPEEVEATIVEMERLSVSEDVRGRYRYLSHLPLTCELALVELDLKAPLLSRATLAVFSGDISGRRQKRLKKKREERRREKKAEAPQPEPTFIVPTSARNMTPEAFHDFLAIASSPVSRSQPPPPVEESLATSPPSAPSFAQALQGKPPPVWPVQSPPKLHIGASPKSVGTKRSTSPDLDEDGGVPTFRDAFNEALASASVTAVSGGKPGSKTAKKGRKKMVLFSTGSTRGTS